jgi:hypothetical protein
MIFIFSGPNGAGSCPGEILFVSSAGRGDQFKLSPWPEASPHDPIPDPDPELSALGTVLPTSTGSPAGQSPSAGEARSPSASLTYAMVSMRTTLADAMVSHRRTARVCRVVTSPRSEAPGFPRTLPSRPPPTRPAWKPQAGTTGSPARTDHCRTRTVGPGRRRADESAVRACASRPDPDVRQP